MSNAPSNATPYPSLTYPELQLAAQQQNNWLWDGFLAPGEVTSLTSLWKAGKSTLVAALLSRLKQGGVFAGFPLRSGRAVVLTEEGPHQWAERAATIPFDDHVTWFCRPFAGKPRHEHWINFLDQVVQMDKERKIDLFVVDPIANLTPLRSENDAGEMLSALLPLQQLTNRDISVLLSHHPRKGAVVLGQAARGSGALSGFVDIIIEMKRPSARFSKDRRRILHAFSRHNMTPPTWVIELNAQGNDYISHGPCAEPRYEHAVPILKSILQNADQPLSRRDIYEAWPADSAPPARHTLWKWLRLAVKECWVDCDGEGTRKNPFRYLLPGMGQKWIDEEMSNLTRRIMANQLPGSQG
jgi:hypothetical protein